MEKGFRGKIVASTDFRNINSKDYYGSIVHCFA